MKKTNKKILEEIIRVDHAGERGAIKIYEGQLLALKTIKQDDELKDKIEKVVIDSIPFLQKGKEIPNKIGNIPKNEFSSYGKNKS